MIMAKFRILDLETIAHPDASTWVGPLSAPSNYKDEAKIAAYIKEAEEERAAKFALNADTCRIVALGFVDVGSNDPTVYLMKDEFEEREQLKMFWESYRKLRPRLVSFNGLHFDLPVLLMRSLYLNVDFPRIKIAPAWKSEAVHTDLYQVLSLDGARDRRDVGSLAFYARRWGIGTLDKVCGADIAQLVAEGNWAAVEAHCLSDVGLTHALANKLGVLEMA